jgi:hypothetical protein
LPGVAPIPVRDAALQIARVDPRRPQRGGRALANLMPMNAMHDHLPTALVGVAMHGGYDQLAGLGEVGGAANVHHDWRRRGAEPGMKIGRGDRRKGLVHDSSPRLSR